jgi:hypothetical protein
MCEGSTGGYYVRGSTRQFTWTVRLKVMLGVLAKRMRYTSIAMLQVSLIVKRCYTESEPRWPCCFWGTDATLLFPVRLVTYTAGASTCSAWGQLGISS